MDKSYTCPVCGTGSKAKDWDEATARRLKCSISQIETIEKANKNGCSYVCPACEVEINGNLVQEVK